MDQFRARVPLPFGNAAPRNTPTQTFRWRNSPHGHNPAVTPPGHTQTRWIDWIFFYRGVDSGERVAQIAAAEIFHVGAGELFSLAITSARIGHQNIVTP